MAAETLDRERTAFLFFDTLNGHLKSGPERALREEYRAAVTNMGRILAAARTARSMVVYAIANHRPDEGMQRQTLTDTDNRLRPWTGPRPVWKQPVIGGQWSGEIVAELAPRPEEYIVPKFRWSAFTGTYLDMALRVHGISTIVIVGGSTDVGVASTVYSARDLDYDLVVVRDACTAHEMDNHDQFMKRIFPRMARVRDTGAVLAMLSRAETPPRG